MLAALVAAAAAAVLMAAVAWAAGTGSPVGLHLVTLPTGPDGSPLGSAGLLGEPAPTAVPSQDPTAGLDIVPVVFRRVMQAVALLLIALCVLAVLNRIRWGRFGLRLTRPDRGLGAFVVGEAAEEEEADETAALARQVRAGIRALDADPAPREAVIACWLRLEAAAAASGVPRGPAETPAELVARVLVAHRVRRPALERLAEAYRWARYSPHRVDEHTRERARRALEDVERDLLAAVGTAGETSRSDAAPVPR